MKKRMMMMMMVVGMHGMIYFHQMERTTRQKRIVTTNEAVTREIDDVIPVLTEEEKVIQVDDIMMTEDDQDILVPDLDHPIVLVMIDPDITGMTEEGETMEGFFLIPFNLATLVPISCLFFFYLYNTSTMALTITDICKFALGKSTFV